MSASGTGLIGGARGGTRGRCPRRVPAGLRVAALVMTVAVCMPVMGTFPAAGATPVAGAFPVTGEISASGRYTLGVECDFAHEVYTGRGELSGFGTVTMDFEFCVAVPAGPGLPFNITRGSFTIETASGALLTGDIGGHLMADSPDEEGLYPGELTFTVTGGTGDLEGAGGSLVFATLTKSILPDRHQMVGTGSGTLTLPDGRNGQAR